METETTTQVNNTTTSEKGSSFVGVVFGFIKSIFGIILNSIKQVLRFFIRLDFAGKVTFILIVLIVILVSYFVGRSAGKSAATDKYEEEITQLENKIKQIQDIAK